MDQLIKLVKTYRVSTGLTERLRLADEIIRQIRPDLHHFVFKAIPTTAADDVVQEILKSIAGSLKNFAGGSADARMFSSSQMESPANPTRCNFRSAGVNLMGKLMTVVANEMRGCVILER